MNAEIEQSSFRDRAGFIFYKQQQVYRAIRHSYRNQWEKLSSAAFFNALISEGKMVSFEEISAPDLSGPDVYKVLKVERIPFISYPCEWTFSQLKKAALLTLDIQRKALLEGFTLKDASAYNVQFIGNKPVFIDTLSFTLYEEGAPWQGYKQFCRHFLAPLLLMKNGLPELKALYLDHIDGIPLQFASRALPFRSRFRLLDYTHIHLHARFEDRHGASRSAKEKKLAISRSRSLSLIEHLRQGIKALSSETKKTNWTGYYNDFSYSKQGYAAKRNFVEKHLSEMKPLLCVDLGANTGEFSELAAKYSRNVLACDSDLEVVSAIQQRKITNVLALHINLENPTPAFGWNNSERQSFAQRIGSADLTLTLTLALALVHHLCIGNNVPLGKVAGFFAGISNTLIIEFVPKTDVQVSRLLVTKKDVFDDYTLENFKIGFSKYFVMADQVKIPGSDRVLFLFRKKVL